MNHLGGSSVSAGPDRLCGAGRAGVPQIVAPGATDMVDFPAWGAPPARWAHGAVHVHNRLIASVVIDADMRRTVAHEIGARLARATGPTALLQPLQGIEGWDRPGGPMHDPAGLAAFNAALPAALAAGTQHVVVDAHINDAAFADAALAVLDGWVQAGVVRPGVPPGVPQEVPPGAQPGPAAPTTPRT